MRRMQLPPCETTTRNSRHGDDINEYELSVRVIIINGDGKCGQQQPTGRLTPSVKSAFVK